MTARRDLMRFVAPLVGMVVLLAFARVPVAPLRAAVALPLALILPGYALTRALPDLGGERGAATWLALSFVLSLASYPLLGLLLYAAGIKISQATILAAVEAEVLVATAAAAVGPRARLDDGTNGVKATRTGRARCALLAAPLIAVVAIPVAARHLLPPPAVPPFSQLYLLGAESRGAGFVTVQKRLAVDVGARNETGGSRRYTLVGRLDADPPVPVASFKLPNGDRWTRRVTVIVPRSPCAHRVQFLLRDDERGRDVASVQVWARRTGASRCGGVRR
jgi:uncharacterized membrane protein